MDENIALSIINMKLRDFYSSLDELLDQMDNAEELVDILYQNNYFYNENTNRFERKN